MEDNFYLFETRFTLAFISSSIFADNFRIIFEKFVVQVKVGLYQD